MWDAIPEKGMGDPVDWIPSSNKGADLFFASCPFRWLLACFLLGPLLAGCELTERFANPEDRINAAVPPDSGVQAARQRLLSQVADQPALQQAFEPRWASRMRSRAVLCRRDYLPSWRDSQADIRARLKASECFAEFDRTLERWVGLQRLQMVLALPALHPVPKTLPLLISHREFISGLVLAREAPVAILQGSNGFDVVNLGTGKSIYSEAAPGGRPILNLAPNGRAFAQSGSGGVAIRATEGGETLVELPLADGVLWLDSNALILRNGNRTGSQGLRLLDLTSGEDTQVPGNSNGFAYLSAPVPGSTSRFNLLLNNGADQIELSNVSGRFEAQLRKEQRSKSGRGFAINTGGMNADGTKWIDGSQGLRTLNLDTLEMQERTFEPARSSMAWPTANPDQTIISLATPSGNGVTSVVDPYLYTESTGTLAKLVLERRASTRFQYIGSVKKLAVLEGQNLRYVDELQTEPAQPIDNVLSALTSEINQRRLAAAYAAPDGQPGMRATGALPGGATQPPTALHQQLRDSQVEGVGVYEGAGAVHGAGRPRMPGMVLVHVRRSTTPTALVLSSYEPVRWRIVVDPGARLSAVFVSSYYPSTVEGANAVRVYQMDAGYAYQRNSPEFAKLQRATIEWTGKPMSLFQGSYKGGSFSVGGS